MADKLRLSAKDFNNSLWWQADLLDEVIWEDEPWSSRWESHHSGVFQWKDKFYMAKWTLGLTESQEHRSFEDYELPDGSVEFEEAESYDVTITKWRIKHD